MSEIQAWTEVDRSQAFKKYSRRIDRVDFELPDGSEADFYIKSEATTAAVLAITTDQKVVLARQFRPGPKLILNELPGGFIDPDESPLETIRREFEEETGYTGNFEFVTACLDDAYSTMVRYCYVARDCYMIGEPKTSTTEMTAIVLMTLEDFKQQLRSGQMTDIEVGYLGLDHLGLL